MNVPCSVSFPSRRPLPTLETCSLFDVLYDVESCSRAQLAAHQFQHQDLRRTCRSGAGGLQRCNDRRRRGRHAANCHSQVNFVSPVCDRTSQKILTFVGQLGTRHSCGSVDGTTITVAVCIQYNGIPTSTNPQPFHREHDGAVCYR